MEFRSLCALESVRKVLERKFISVGNGIDLEETTKIVCNFVTKESHIPLPTRLADMETHKKRREAQISISS